MNKILKPSYGKVKQFLECNEIEKSKRMLHIILNHSSTKNCAVAIATIVVEKQKDYSKIINSTQSTFVDFLEDVG